MHVGQAIKAAMERADRHMAVHGRQLRVRFYTVHGDYQDGLTIAATIAARSPQELEAQADIGVRRVPWLELDERAGDLVGLVDAVVAEVEAALGIKPSS